MKLFLIATLCIPLSTIAMSSGYSYDGNNAKYSHASEPISEFIHYEKNVKISYKPNTQKILSHHFEITAHDHHYYIRLLNETGIFGFIKMKCKYGHCTLKTFETIQSTFDAPEPKDTACNLFSRAVAFAKMHDYRSVTGWNKTLMEKNCYEKMSKTILCNKENICTLYPKE